MKLNSEHTGCVVKTHKQAPSSCNFKYINVCLFALCLSSRRQTDRYRERVQFAINSIIIDAVYCLTSKIQKLLHYRMGCPFYNFIYNSQIYYNLHSMCNKKKAEMFQVSTICLCGFLTADNR